MPDGESVNRPTLLIVDDNKDILSFLENLLSPHYTLLLASNANDALLKLESSLVQLIICDVLMPELDGITLVKQIRKLAVNGTTPVIILSSQQSVHSQIQGIEAGADAYLTKPFTPRHLMAVVEQLLNRHQKLKHYFDSPMASVELVNGKAMNRENIELIAKLNQFVLDNIDNEKLSIETLASEMLWSKSQLYRKIKELQRITPTEFIRQVRLKQAEKLLLTSSKTVQEIMYCCGFNNKAYFYREFAKQFKATPSEHRKNKTMAN